MTGGDARGRKDMLKLYGSPLCPDCRNCRTNFDLHGIKYEYHDIMASLSDLKAFLRLRDTLPVFDRLKAVGDIAIPAVEDEDGTVFTDWEGYLKECGLAIAYEEGGAACSLDRKNC